ncbi:unnamed protein product [Meloidogyne enterolobii]
MQQCICERLSCLVVCRSPCSIHPRRIALMDLRECPNCRSVQLSEVA